MDKIALVVIIVVLAIICVGGVIMHSNTSIAENVKINSVSFLNFSNPLLPGASLIQLNVTNACASSIEITGVYVNDSSTLLVRPIITPVSLVSGENCTLIIKYPWVPDGITYKIEVVTAKGDRFFTTAKSP